ncbi:response regulator [Paraburkholderia azotifigens]|uniref:response regulator n=1 Tax=Paraburkholderia azotifigens TaxID=2057004 RepID=UPI0031723191
MGRRIAIAQTRLMDQSFAKLPVYVIEDSALVLRQLVALVRATGLAEVVGTADDANKALSDIASLRPDVVLIDLHLRVGSGMDVIAGMKQAGCPAISIALTNHATQMVRDAACAAGVDYFYDKTSEFMLAIARIGEIARARVAREDRH